MSSIKMLHKMKFYVHKDFENLEGTLVVTSHYDLSIWLLCCFVAHRTLSGCVPSAIFRIRRDLFRFQFISADVPSVRTSLLVHLIYQCLYFSGVCLVKWRLSVPSVQKVVGSTPPLAAT